MRQPCPSCPCAPTVPPLTVQHRSTAGAAACGDPQQPPAAPDPAQMMIMQQAICADRGACGGGGRPGRRYRRATCRGSVAGVVLLDQRLRVCASGPGDGADVPARIEVSAAGGEVVPFDPLTI